MKHSGLARIIALVLGVVLSFCVALVTAWLFDLVGLMGGALCVNRVIVATGFGESFDEMKKSGVGRIIALVLGVVLSFFVGAVIAWFFGYRAPVVLTTIGAGMATYIVGPVT